MSEIQNNNSNRIKNSFGTCYINAPQIIDVENTVATTQYEIDYDRKFYIFNVIPMGAVRMTQSDKWKLNPNHVDPKKRQREVVSRYFEFKNQIKLQAEQMNYKLGEILEIIFLVPMPFTWSEKKKVKHNKLPVKTRPDIDNYVKSFMDALENEDGFVWNIKAQKRYAFKGSILVYE